MVNPRESLALTMALTRAFISLAALFVNVSARIRLAGTPSRSRYAIRLVMTRVLPVPAPARIKSGPCVVLTAESCGPAALVEQIVDVFAVCHPELAGGHRTDARERSRPCQHVYD